MTAPRTDSTASTVDLLAMLYDRLIGYRGPNNTSVGGVLGSADGTVRLYQVRAPDNTIFPYATMRLSTTRDGSYKGLRVEGMLEILLYGRPWSEQVRMEGLADLIDQAMLFFVRSNDGLTFTRAAQRNTLPVAPSPADSETVTIRLVYNLVVWPRYLTRITTH